MSQYLTASPCLQTQISPIKHPDELVPVRKVSEVVMDRGTKESHLPEVQNRWEFVGEEWIL